MPLHLSLTLDLHFNNGERYDDEDGTAIAIFPRASSKVSWTCASSMVSDAMTRMVPLVPHWTWDAPGVVGFCWVDRGLLVVGVGWFRGVDCFMGVGLIRWCGLICGCWVDFVVWVLGWFVGLGWFGGFGCEGFFLVSFFSAIVCGCCGFGWWLVAAMVGGCGGFFFFFFFSVVVCGCGGFGWWWRWWVDVVVVVWVVECGGCGMCWSRRTGLRKRDTKEREIERERIKN